MFLILENNIVIERHTTLSGTGIDPINDPTVIFYTGIKICEVGWVWIDGEVYPPD